MYYDNPHANIVVGLTEQLWRPIPISLEMAKVEDLKPMIIGLRPCALAATRISTKERNSQNPKGLRCGKKLIERQ
jgi:hypothetical protein